jgi:phosphonatase-like hydrolase
MKKLELVVFDMAGTTIRDDDAVNRCLREALSFGGVEVSRDQVNAVMGIPKPAAIASLLSARQAAPVSAEHATVRRLHREFLRRMIAFYEQDPAVAPMPGARECFETLRGRGAKLALDTGFSRDIVDVILRRLGWEVPDVLDATVTSDEVPRGRPHPDLIFEAMRRTGVTDPANVAKVGDTPSDLQEGIAAGCGWVVGVTNGSHTREQLLPHAHTHLIRCLAELPAALR